MLCDVAAVSGLQVYGSNKSTKYREVLERLTVEFTTWQGIDYRHDRRFVNAWLSYVN